MDRGLTIRKGPSPKNDDKQLLENFDRYISRDAGELNELASRAGEDAYYLPLGSGELCASSFMRTRAGIVALHETYGPDMQVVGAPSSRFVFMVLPTSPVKILGRMIDSNNILLIGPGQEFDAVFPRGAKLMLFQVPTAMLTEAAARFNEPNPFDRLTVLTPRVDFRIRESLLSSNAVFYQEPGVSQSEAELRSLFPACAFELLNSSRANEVTSTTRRYRVVRQAREYLEQHLNSPIQLEDLCQQTNASRRTLMRAFNDVYGMSPMAYRNQRRLLKAREALQRGLSNVTEAALDAGFSHLGRFSNVYKTAFGELPSETVRIRRCFAVQIGGSSPSSS